MTRQSRLEGKRSSPLLTVADGAGPMAPDLAQDLDLLLVERRNCRRRARSQRLLPAAISPTATIDGLQEVAPELCLARDRGRASRLLPVRVFRTRWALRHRPCVVMTTVENVTRCEARRRFAQVFDAQAGIAAPAQRDRRLVNPLFSAGIAKHDLGLLCDAVALWTLTGQASRQAAAGRRLGWGSHTALASRAALVLLRQALLAAPARPKGRVDGPSAEGSAGWAASAHLRGRLPGPDQRRDRVDS